MCNKYKNSNLDQVKLPNILISTKIEAFTLCIKLEGFYSLTSLYCKMNQVLNHMLLNWIRQQTQSDELFDMIWQYKLNNLFQIK